MYMSCQLVWGLCLSPHCVCLCVYASSCVCFLLHLDATYQLARSALRCFRRPSTQLFLRTGEHKQITPSAHGCNGSTVQFQMWANSPLLPAVCHIMPALQCGLTCCAQCPTCSALWSHLLIAILIPAACVGLLLVSTLCGFVCICEFVCVALLHPEPPPQLAPSAFRCLCPPSTQLVRRAGPVEQPTPSDLGCEGSTVHIQR